MIRPYTKPPNYGYVSADKQIQALTGALGGHAESKLLLWSVGFGIMLSRLNQTRIPKHFRDDIIQEWALYFFSALADFDPSRGCSPASFFYRRAGHTIRNFLLAHSGPIKVPRENRGPPLPFPSFVSCYDTTLAEIPQEDPCLTM